jgi:hypothetical protein
VRASALVLVVEVSVERPRVPGDARGPERPRRVQAKLPADAQGDGLVILHHTSSLSTAPFAAAATYDVAPPAGPYGLTWGRMMLEV